MKTYLIATIYCHSTGKKLVQQVEHLSLKIPTHYPKFCSLLHTLLGSVV